MAEGETTLEYTPTWVVAAVCSVVVLISLAVERVLYYTDKACIHFSSHFTHIYIYLGIVLLVG